MKRVFLLAGAMLLGASILPASANDRYAERPPVVVSPDLSAPWVIQLGHKPGKVLLRKRKAFPNEVESRRNVRRLMGGRNQGRTDQVRTATVAPQEKRAVRREMNPVYLPQEVAYDGTEKPGTIIIDTNQPWTIGQAVSSGCIRMRNEDVVELYERTGVGAKVVVM